jgi:hypothetical protein
MSAACGREANVSGTLPMSARRELAPALIVLAVAILACAVYANLALVVTDPSHYRFFPPFRAHVDGNASKHLGGEYFQMARALRAGEGFAHPFDRPTGPTAWQPPVLPAILAGMLWLCDDSRAGVMALVIFVQVLVLIGTGWLVLALVQRTAPGIAPAVTALVFFAMLVDHFFLCFQLTHDSWLVLLTIDLLLAGCCFVAVLSSYRSATAWGVFGGLSAMINPCVGLAWGGLTLVMALRRRAWSELAVALVAAALTLLPWTVRNYLVFGRFIPSKSNLAFELYQSQCLQPSGLLLRFQGHPYAARSPERRAYEELGEAGFLDLKWQQFWASVQAQPLGFADRAAERFLGATLWYEPFQRPNQPPRSWVVWLGRLTHPLPFLALLLLVGSGCWRPLTWPQWVAIAVYVLYLLPYVLASYYDRYGMPLIGVKTLLVLWAIERIRSGMRRGGAADVA